MLSISTVYSLLFFIQSTASFTVPIHSATTHNRRFSQRFAGSSILSSASSPLQESDYKYMMMAVEYAAKGLGHTFPNPAVGCVIVEESPSETDIDDDDDEYDRTEQGTIIGAGFHPRAGYPHAEIFALLQAANHVTSGVDAAMSVVNAVTETTVQELTDIYIEQGPAALFQNIFQNRQVTAYVTLEPCCHVGKRTPPCAASLQLAGIQRVVVGVRDPNPRVDGGGVSFLQNAGIQVDLVPNNNDKSKSNDVTYRACQDLIQNFIKRITPREHDNKTYSYVTGAMRAALRSTANRKKAQGTLAEVTWGSGSTELPQQQQQQQQQAVPEEENDNLEQAIAALPLKAEWMEHVDGVLWQNELILLRLNKIVNKKKGAKLLGQRIAEALEAHVVQTVGHTCLLYRPGMPPKLDLEALVQEAKEE